MKTKITLFLLLIMTLTAVGQNSRIAAYSGTWPARSSNSVANITTSPITLGPGANNNSSTNGVIRTNGYPTNNSINGNSYLEWSVTAAPGYIVNVSKISLAYLRDLGFLTLGGGPQKFQIRSSVDGFGSVIESKDGVPYAITMEDFTPNKLQQSENGGTITFRLYPYGNDWYETGNFIIDDEYGTVLGVQRTGIILSGSVLLDNETLVYTNGTWSPNAPSATTGDKNVLIAAGVFPLNSDIKAKNLRIATTNAGISVLPAGSISLSGNLITSDNLTLRSSSTNYSSLIVNGTVTGPAKYIRHVNVNTAGNDLISAPVTGQSFTSFILENANIYANANETLYLFGPFSKTTGEYLTWSNATTTALAPAIGYKAASENNSTLTFVGKVNTTAISTPLVYGGPKYVEWNLVGNPYPSYVDGIQFLARNMNLLSPNAAAIYGHDGNSYDGWRIMTLANMGTPGFPKNMTPGQGFLLATKPGGGNVVFEPYMRLVAHDDDYISGRPADSNNAHTVLQISNGSETYSTGVYFNENSSKAMDTGYDATVYGNNAPKFSIYSNLINDNAALQLAVQSLSFDDLSTDINIPIGINATKGQQITVSLADVSIPEGFDVYLEDNVSKTFTKLTESDYTFTSNTNLVGTGRFFLSFKGTTLGLEPEVMNGLHIFTKSKTVSIKGLLNDTTTVTVYDIQGRIINSRQLKANSTINELDLSQVDTGIYVIKLKNSSQEKTQKVILK